MSVDVNAVASTCPDGWRNVPLSSVADIRFSSVDKKSESGEKPVRLCNYTDVYNNDYVTADMEFMRATATITEIERFGLSVGDVIITKDSETPDDIGVPTIVDSTTPELVCGYHLALIRPNQDAVDPTFLAKQLSHSRVIRYFGQQANGTTRYGLSTTAIAGTRLHLPSKPQQAAVSRLLRLVDAAIERTGAVIGKLKQVRAGLLHDLLTRGLDDNGELRDPDKHPERFQDSPLGRFPCCWTPETVRACLRDNPQNGVYKPARQIGKGVLLIGQTCIDDDRRIDIAFARRVDVAPVETSRYGLTEGDILVSRVFATLDGVGQPALVPALGESAVYESNMMRLVVDRERVHPRLLFESLRQATVRARIVAAAHLSNQASINQAGLNSIPLFLPPVTEQREVVRRIALHEQTINAVTRDEYKLKQLKSGLMSDLLTGRVPMPETINLGEPT